MRSDLGDGVTYIDRAEWAGTRQIVGQPESRDPASIDEFIVHHSGGVELGDPDPLQWCRNIYDYHVHTLGYDAEAYEGFVALHEGRVFVLGGRPIGIDSAATYAHNARGYAVCYLRANGDGDIDSVVPDLVKVGFRKVAQITAFTVGHTLSALGHRDCREDSTACPGNDLDGWVHTGDIWTPFSSHATGKPLPAPTGWPPFAGQPLKMGSNGNQVRLWQTRMTQLGAGQLAVDGQFGRLTEDVTRWFQGTHHLATDGVVGPLTWSAAG